MGLEWFGVWGVLCAVITGRPTLPPTHTHIHPPQNNHQMEPFRVFLALLVNLALVLASAALVLHARLWAKPHPSQPQAITPAMHRFPRRSVLLIAALDAMQLAVMVRACVVVGGVCGGFSGGVWVD